MMYDTKETDHSHRLLMRLVEELDSIKDAFVVIGGWAVYYLTRDEFKKATGSDYLRSRDIDIVISSKREDVVNINKAISYLGFTKGAYPFRYEQYVDWDSGELIDPAMAKKRPVYELVHIFLDVFSASKVDIGTWVIPEFKTALKNTKEIDGIPVAEAGIVLGMKMKALMERDNPEKRQKDACDVFSLLFYSGHTMTNKERNGYEKELSTLANDYSAIIADILFKDKGLSGIVRRRIESLSANNR